MIVRTNVVVIGAGYYGCYATYKLAELYPDLDFTLVEKESEICTRASSTNQGQFHRGYMYTAKPKLALECSKFAIEFEKEFKGAIDHTVKSYYGVHEDSLVTPSEFEATCDMASLPLEKIADIDTSIFGKKVVASYKTEEKSIDTAEMRKIMAIRLFRPNINLMRSTNVERVEELPNGVRIHCSDENLIEADLVINASFAGINNLHANSGIKPITTKNDVFLHFMLSLPKRYKNIAATVAVGSYCSMIPSRYRGSHLLAVGGIRSIASSLDFAPKELVRHDLARQLFKQCQEECAEWIPALKVAKLVGFTVGTRTEFRDPKTNKSMSEVKVLVNHDGLKKYVVLLGGKISCLSECVEPLVERIEKLKFDMAPSDKVLA